MLAIAACLNGSAAAQSPADAAPFQSEWAVIVGAGQSLGRGERAGREQASQGIAWGQIVSAEYGPGLIRGRLEMLIEITPLFLAFQSNRARGAGFSPLMLRWNLRERGRLSPFIELAGGFVATNQDVPEGTTRLNFSSHAGPGVRVRVSRRWSVLAGYRLQHLSNGTTAPRNPGINSNVGYAGLAYRQR